MQPIVFTAIRWQSRSFFLPISQFTCKSNNAIHIMKVFLIPFCLMVLLSPVRVPAQNSDDIRDTGAFLVKLKPQATPSSRAGVPDEWEFTPLEAEAVNREEATPTGNWWYLAPQASGMATRGASPETAQAVNPWDAAYNHYAAD